jgi:hypothetical protein
MHAAQVVTAVAVGLAGFPAGSYATVLAERIPDAQSVLRPVGRCPLCGSALTAAKMIPVLSWVRQHARCAACGQPYGRRHLAAELITPGALAALGYRIGPSMLLAPLLAPAPLPLRPLSGAPLLPGGRPASRQVIAARRHRGAPRVPGRRPQSRAQLLPQPRDQGLQRRDLLILRFEPRRLLTDQRITRILRRQRIAHGTRSSPKPAPAAATTPCPQRNRDL